MTISFSLRCKFIFDQQNNSFKRVQCKFSKTIHCNIIKLLY